MPLTASSSRPRIIRIMGRARLFFFVSNGNPGRGGPLHFWQSPLAGRPLPRLTRLNRFWPGSTLVELLRGSGTRGGSRKRFLKSFEKLEDDEGGVKVNCWERMRVRYKETTFVKFAKWRLELFERVFGILKKCDQVWLINKMFVKWKTRFEV